MKKITLFSVLSILVVVFALFINNEKESESPQLEKQVLNQAIAQDYANLDTILNPHDIAQLIQINEDSTIIVRNSFSDKDFQLNENGWLAENGDLYTLKIKPLQEKEEGSILKKRY